MILRSSMMKRILLVVSCFLIVAAIGVSFCKPSTAAATFVFSATAVNDGAFKITVGFPSVNWGAFDVSVQYDSAVVQVSSNATKKSGDEYEVNWQRPNLNSANASGEYNIVGAGDGTIDMTNSGLVITIPFAVKSNTATSTTIKLIVNEFVDPSTTPISATSPTVLSITLKTPSSSTDGGGSGSTSSTTDDTPVSTSTTTNTTTSTKTDTNTTTTKTDTNTTTKTDSSTKPTGPVVSSTTSDTGTEPDVTDSEELTDTETNFPLSDSNSETDVSMSETDNTDTTSDQSSSVISTVTSSTQEEPKKEISTGMIALISVGVSVVICGALTVVGLLRHKKEQE